MASMIRMTIKSLRYLIVKAVSISGEKSGYILILN